MMIKKKFMVLYVAAVFSTTPTKVSMASDAGELTLDTIYEMYLANNGDVLDVPAMAMFFAFNQFSEHKGCMEYGVKWREADEFDKPELLAGVQKALLSRINQATGQATKHTVTLMSSTLLGEYDSKRQGFPVTNVAVETPNVNPEFSCYRMWKNSVPAQGSSLVPDNIGFKLGGVESINFLPMPVSNARSLLKQQKAMHDVAIAKNKWDPVWMTGPRRMNFKLEFEAGPIPITGGKFAGVPLALKNAKAVSPMDGRQIHIFDFATTDTKKTGLKSVAAPANRPFTQFWSNLHAFQLFESVASDEFYARAAGNQILVEKALRENFKPRHNDNKRYLSYEWPDIKNQSRESRTAFFNVVANLQDDWSFVAKDPSWDPRFESVAAIFLFSEDEVKGADSAVAGYEYKERIKSFFQSMAEQLDTSKPFFLDVLLPQHQVDIPTGRITYSSGIPKQLVTEQGIRIFNEATNLSFGVINDLKEKLKTPAKKYTLGIPGDFEGLAAYYLPAASVRESSNHRSSLSLPVGLRVERKTAINLGAALAHSPVQTNMIASDKILVVRPFGVDVKSGIDFRSRFTARVNFAVSDVKKIINNNARKDYIYTLTKAKILGVDILSADNKVIHSFKRDDLVNAQESYKARQSAKAKTTKEKQDAVKARHDAAEALRQSGEQLSTAQGKMGNDYDRCSQMNDLESQEKCVNSVCSKLNIEQAVSEQYVGLLNNECQQKKKFELRVIQQQRDSEEQQRESEARKAKRDAEKAKKRAAWEAERAAKKAARNAERQEKTTERTRTINDAMAVQMKMMNCLSLPSQSEKMACIQKHQQEAQ